MFCYCDCCGCGCAAVVFVGVVVLLLKLNMLSCNMVGAAVHHQYSHAVPALSCGSTDASLYRACRFVRAEISAAFAVLSDPEKKQHYDTYGSDEGIGQENVPWLSVDSWSRVRVCFLRQRHDCMHVRVRECVSLCVFAPLALLQERRG